MADIAVTAAQVGLVFPDKAEVYDFLAGQAITAGMAVAQTSVGVLVAADASFTTIGVAKGIALNAAGTGGAVSVLKSGHVYGFTLTSKEYDAMVYVSDTAGILSDAAGTVTNGIGQVVALADSAKTKVLYVDAHWAQTAS